MFIDGAPIKSDCVGRSNVTRAKKKARKQKRRPDSDQTEGRRELGAQKRQQGHCNTGNVEKATDAKTLRIWNAAVTRWESVGPTVKAIALREVEAKRRFTMQYILEELRRRPRVGRDGADVAVDNSYAPAYARLLLRDCPECRPYLETRRSRFDRFVNGECDG